MIVTIPNPVLIKKAKPVARIDSRIIKIVTLMKKSLLSCKNPKGVGLAAPQIGFPLRIFITKPTDDAEIKEFINPECTWKDSALVEIQRPKENKSLPHKEQKLEGCLSVPNVWGYLKRARAVKLRYLDTEGIPHEEKFVGFMATIIQHEMDHLDGILFTQRVIEQKEKLYEIEETADSKEKLVEIEI